MFTKEQLECLEILNKKEQMLEEIIVWLKSKNLWVECQKCLSIKIIDSKEKQ